MMFSIQLLYARIHRLHKSTSLCIGGTLEGGERTAYENVERKGSEGQELGYWGGEAVGTPFGKNTCA